MIECIRIDKINDSLLNQVENTYLSSFPPCERRDFVILKELLLTQPRFAIQALLRDGKYVGFITFWDMEDFCYIEHFAIEESARNGGIGREVLRQFLKQCDMPVVLEVEKPQDEMSKRRIKFYENLGFVLDLHPYQQPPYRQGGNWVDMYLMAYGPIDLSKQYEKVKENLYQYVYAIK